MTASLADLGRVYLRGLSEGRCPSGKLRFATHVAAERALELSRLRSPREVTRRELRIYHDWECGGWHLTSHALDG